MNCCANDWYCKILRVSITNLTSIEKKIQLQVDICVTYRLVIHDTDLLQKNIQFRSSNSLCSFEYKLLLVSGCQESYYVIKYTNLISNKILSE